MMMPSDIPTGTVMTAFFNRITRKNEQQKIKENVIIAISFDVWQGQKVREDKKKTYFLHERNAPYVQGLGQSVKSVPSIYS
jgi:hypothetical protein